MRTLFIMNGITFGSSGQPSVSGGDAILIEIAKRWSRKGVDVHFMTSSAGKELCKRSGLEATYHLSSGNSISSLVNYISLVLKATAVESLTLAKTRFDLVYSSCEHVYDVLPALKLKKLKTKWVAMVHFVPPPPWTRAKAGRVNALLYYLNHSVGAYIIRFAADLVFAVSQRTASDYVSKLNFDEEKVVSVPGGISYELIRSIVGSSKGHKYDAVFMKRLQPMKGAFDVINIWRYVVNKYPEARLLIIGDGPGEIVARMKDMITRLELNENIELIGPVYNMREKFSLLANSKLFLLPSHEENWAIVIGEALAVGLPVIVYDLPEIRDIWKNNVLWVAKGDTVAFARKIISLLSNESSYLPSVEDRIFFVKQFDWDSIAERELELCTKLIASE